MWYIKEVESFIIERFFYKADLIVFYSTVESSYSLAFSGNLKSSDTSTFGINRELHYLSTSLVLITRWNEA